MPAKTTTESTASVRGTSYDTICAAPRMPPSVAYELPLAHPPNSMPSTEIDGTARKNSTPTDVSSGAHPFANGITASDIATGVKTTSGAMR